jgi:hypothetical protein
MPPSLAPTGDKRTAKLVVVTGSGRSGTSTVTGALKKLGFYVPQPEIPPNDANPRGYFEPKWVVEYQKKVLAQAGVRTLDGRPVAEQLMGAVTTDAALLTELREWFAGQLKGPQIVVKDPRTFWLRDLWLRAAGDLGVSTAWLTMLRHPAEVVGSRDMHYLKGADAERRLARETGNLAGWVNVGLTNERTSRGTSRAFVHYSDLVSDWRGTMTGLADRLGLSYDADLSSGEHHEVDDFIDATLRRSQRTLDDLDVPMELRGIAEEVWRALDGLTADPSDETVMRRMDELRARYEQLYTHAVALAQDHTNSAIEATRQRVRRRVTRELRAQAQKEPDGVGHRSLGRRVARRIRSARSTLSSRSAR